VPAPYIYVYGRPSDLFLSQFISPMLIIWRVSVGRAWSRSTVQNAYSSGGHSSNSTKLGEIRFTTKTERSTDNYGSASEFTKTERDLV
jgi:hypothetical protein